MNYRKVVTATVGIAALLMSGCAETPIGGGTLLDRTFGDAVRAARLQQTLNPNASQNFVAPAGLDGQAAKATIDRYERSFEMPPPPVNVFTIGVGSGAGGGAR